MNNSKPKLTAKNREIVQKVQELIEPLGCTVTGLGGNAVAVLGDARYVGKAIVITIGPNCDSTEVSTLIVNRVKGIARVLMDIPHGNAK